MRIDAHQHFWLMKNREGSWPPADLAAIHRDFKPQDLEPILRQVGIDGTVVVQSLPEIADTEYLLGLAEHNAFILGIVGWVDLKAPDAPQTISRLAANPKLKGVRPMLQDIEDVNWIDDPLLKPGIEALCDNGLAFDALALPQHLGPLANFVRQYPELRVVIDHGAKPHIARGEFVSWRRNMAELASFPNVCCKLSGMLTEAGDQKPEAIRPYAETILELFGPTRTMWGSDWPVLGLVSDYQSWYQQCIDIVPSQDHADVFGQTAIKFYRLDSATENRTLA